MKLLFFNHVGFIGGAERILLDVLASIRSHCPEIEIILIAGSAGALIDAATDLGVNVIYLPMPASMSQLGDSHLKGDWKPLKTLKTLTQVAGSANALLRYLRRLRQTIQTIEPDLIHSNGVKAHALLSLLGRLNCPVVWHIQDFYSTRPIMAKVLRTLSRSTTSAIALSDAVKRDANTVIAPVPIDVIYPAVNHHYFREESVRSHVLRIGLVATFARWKGHDIFLQAAAQVMSELKDVSIQFQIVGAPIYNTQGSQFSLAELQSRVAQLGLDQVVRFVGFQSDTASIYNHLDIVVHASTQPEPFGLVIAEAMAFGKAVIIANAGGAAELVTDQHDAIALPPGDVNALAQALIHLIQNPQKRQQLGQNARQTAIARFNSDRIGAALLQVYRDCGCVDRSLEKV
ncbi:glycosyltransferase [Leptolyngbya sp. DQ-M1]|uniref:glycosyltransferase n=1 Tax=Leptolyngbya sp. DQ-M1 TaxID=2933920 RepID=UPI003299D4FC